MADRLVATVDLDKSPGKDGCKLESAAIVKRNVRALRAAVFGMSEVRKGAVFKQEAAQPGKGSSSGQSNALKLDPFVKLTQDGQLVEPPLDMLTLAMIVENSTEVGPAIDAMTVNVESFGWKLQPRVPIDEKTPDEILKILAEERATAENFFGSCFPDGCFEDLREYVRRDLEATGNAYIEFIEVPGKAGVDGLSHLPSWSVRIAPPDREPSPYTDLQIKKDIRMVEEAPPQPDGMTGEPPEGMHMIKKRLKEEVSYSLQEVIRFKRFRRYAQRRANKIVWFKELGDPRVISSKTGKPVTEQELLDSREDWPSVPRFTLSGREVVVQTGTQGFPVAWAANPVRHLRLYSTRSSYGLPRYTGHLFAIFGSRAADEINYTTFKNNNIPSMAITVANGQLTEETVGRVQEFLESAIQSDDNYSKILLLEAEPTSEGLRDPGTMKIDIQPLTREQHTDALFTKYQENNDDRVRRAWRFPPIFVGKCHSQDTEFLTDSGWKLFDDVADGDLLATQSENGQLEYQTPTARHEYPYDGELLHLKNRGIDAMVTPNHRMKVRGLTAPERPTKPWEMWEAKDLAAISGRVELPVSTKWEGEELATFEIPPNLRKNARDINAPSKNLKRDAARRQRWLRENDAREVSMDAFLRFLGYFVAEGSTTETRGPFRYGQNRGPVAEKMIAAIREIGFSDPTIVESRPGQLSISTSHVGLWAWLRENVGTGSHDKRIPRWVLGLSRRQLRIFLNAYVEGDGSRDLRGSDGSFSSSTISPLLSDQLQEMCFKLGYASTVRKVEFDNPKHQTQYILYAHVDLTHSLQVESQIERVPYCGRVICFSTPNGTLVTRRGGRVLVSGNSEDFTGRTIEASRKLADEQVFTPERQRVDRFYTRDVLTRLGIIWSTFKSLSPNVTENADLIKLLPLAEKTGSITPRIGRDIMGIVLNRDLGEVDPDVLDPDKPFSLTLAELMKDKSATQAGSGPTSQGRTGVATPAAPRDRTSEPAGSVESLAEMLRREVASRFGGFVPPAFEDYDYEEEEI